LTPLAAVVAGLSTVARRQMAALAAAAVRWAAVPAPEGQAAKGITVVPGLLARRFCPPLVVAARVPSV
jgi:hypothetical protein